MIELLRVLQVEDSESDAALIVRLLENAGFALQFERVDESESFRKALARREWDIVISDNRLPRFDAAEALRIRNECAPDIPFIVVSATIGEDYAVEMMRAGAQDYVLKDRLSRLVPAVRREVQEAQSRREHCIVKDRLRDRDEWLALAVGATHLGMFDYYPQSGKLVLSEHGYVHVGLSPDSPVAYKSIIESLHADDRARVSALVSQAMNQASGGYFMAECRTVGITDQVERWLAAQGRVLFDSDRQPVRFVGVTQDITRRKQFEAQFTILDEAKNDFINLISHEFRTPLNGILGVGDLILDQMPSNADNKVLQQIFGSCRRRILSILDDAVLLAEINVGERFNCALVSLQSALTLGVQKAGDFAASRSVSINPSTSAPGFVLVNEQLLARAFQSLLETAVKFSDEGKSVRLSHNTLLPGLNIVVESDGKTIPDSFLPKFFDIFSISDAISDGGDLGLGPAVACRILSLFGASVTVVNQEPPGIRLTISLKDAAPSKLSHT